MSRLSPDETRRVEGHLRQKDCYEVLDYLKSIIKESPHVTIADIFDEIERFYNSFESRMYDYNTEPGDWSDKKLSELLGDWWNSTDYKEFVDKNMEMEDE